ncbi:hypothetical protein HJFPF1_10469 [Paramyrothecium foliicola]|nr:hypothetical protein HJFPF1_10469 [Paramyrothecium foliicola]
MAHTNGFPQRPHETMQQPVFDIYIDPSFGGNDICTGKHSVNEYATEPWLHYGSAKDTYFSLRFGQRDQFLDNLDNSHQKIRLKEEVERINEVRLRLNLSGEKRALIADLETSYREWRDEVTTNINSYITTADATKPEDKTYDNKSRDLALLRRIRAGHWEKAQGRVQENQAVPPLSPDFGFKAGVMCFKRKENTSGYVGHDYEPQHCAGHFPHQKIPVHQLLDPNVDNLLGKRQDDCQAMARYYGVCHVEPDDHKPISNMSDCERVLSREFWRGQMHGSGGRAPVHARHMRSRCSVIPRSKEEAPIQTRCEGGGQLETTSTATTQTQNSQSSNEGAKPRRRSTQKSNMGKNLGLFLPYLHWETDSRRANMDRIIKDVMKKHDVRRGAARTQTRNIVTLLQQKTEKSQSWSRKGGGLFQEKKQKPLLKYLINAAKVFNAIDHEADEELIRANLHKNPPIHVRRTLDQYYFLTLDDTSTRDRDQVVYRETGAGRPGAGRSSRVVMVDQLWLWILDDTLYSWNFLPSESEVPGTRSKYLEINPEGILLKESQDIVEELNIMQQIFTQQAQVVKVFRRHLGNLNGDDRAGMKTFLNGLKSVVQGVKQESTISLDDSLQEWESYRDPKPLDDTVQEADTLLELIDSRQAELQDLKDSALRTCQQLEQLLSLKQQQASIVEAKAALLRADESIKQGRAIMAFTLVTIFFLPLGFFAGFFGMNNQQSTGDKWMTLPEQIKYMFMLSSLVVLLSVPIAFSSWVRVVLTLMFRIPLKKVADFIGLHRLWRLFKLDYVNLERKKMRSLEELARKEWEKDKARRKREEDKMNQLKSTGDGTVGSHSGTLQNGSSSTLRQFSGSDSV